MSSYNHIDIKYYADTDHVYVYMGKGVASEREGSVASKREQRVAPKRGAST